MGLRDICERRVAAQEFFGLSGSEDFSQRIAELSAAVSVSDFLDVCPEELQFGEGEVVAIRVGYGFKLRFRANQETAALADGKIDWSKVTRIRLLSVTRDD